VQTFKKRKSYYEGKAVHFEYSEHRTEPICEHFGVCGEMAKYEIQPTVVLQTK
jgi:tRNA/tmRNA/rRNA uracil-C5-methylase (TrmA/RlmC/RlmD family)